MNELDELDGLIDDTAYVPSFAARETKKKQIFKPKSTTNNEDSNSRNQSPPISLNSNRSGGGLMGLHKEAKRESTTIENFFKQQNEPDKNLSSMAGQNRSTANLLNSSQQEPQFMPSQRGAMRRPISRGTDKQIQPQKAPEADSPPIPRRGMMPPLNRKSQSKGQIGLKMDTNYSIDFNDGPANKNMSTAKKADDLDPLEALSKDEDKQARKIMEQQMEMQKKGLQKIIEQQRNAKRIEIESLKKLHKEELTKKLELKDYQIQKLKEFYEMQLNLKTNINIEKKQLSATNSKIQENLKQLQKLQSRINEQYKQMHKKQMTENDTEVSRRQLLLEKRQRELHDMEKKLTEFQRQLKADKQRFYKEMDRQRNKMDETSSKLNQRQNELESKYRKRQKQLEQQYEKKRSDLDHERQKMRYQSLQSQQRKLHLEQQERDLKRKIKSFEDKQKQILEQLHQQRTKQMEKDIEVSTKLSQVSMKESEIQMQRQQLINKMKILELQRKRLDIESKGSLKPSLNATTAMDRTFNIDRNKDIRLNHAGNFEQYSKTISQMRDEMMRSMPKF